MWGSGAVTRRKSQGRYHYYCCSNTGVLEFRFIYAKLQLLYYDRIWISILVMGH